MKVGVSLIPGLDCPLHLRPFDGTRTPDMPLVPGVYYFLDENQHILYIGKSIHLRQRINDHILHARSHSKTQKMIHQSRFIAWRETIGDFHAQLLENREIKEYMPLYNRAQRRLKRCFTWRVDVSSQVKCVLESRDGSSPSFTDTPCYGIFKSQSAGKAAILALADEEGVCLRKIGLEKGKGRCFRSQINKCFGACAGLETEEEMYERFMQALLPWCFESWPGQQPQLVAEGDGWHLLYQWQSYGVYAQKPNQKQIQQILKMSSASFEKDEYRILKRLIKSQNETRELLCDYTQSV